MAGELGYFTMFFFYLIIYHSLREQESKNLPDWGKMEFYDYPPKPWSEVLSGASSQGRDLVAQLVRYESHERISAAEVGYKLTTSKLLPAINIML
jgi:hypothetical protein